MNWQEPTGDPLDDLLQKASWPEARLEQLERLERGWKRTVRRRKIVPIASAAAVVLIPAIGVVGLLAIRDNGRPAEPHTTQQHTVEQRIAEQPQPTSAVVAHSPEPDRPQQVAVVPSQPAESPAQIAVEPTAYELALARIHRRQIAAIQGATKHATKQAPSPTVEPDPIAGAIQRLINEPELQSQSIAQGLALKIPRAEAKLQRLLQTAASNPLETPELRAAKRHAALRLLGTLATRDSAPLLLAALRDKESPVEVVEAVARLCSIEQLSARARTEVIAERQSVWLAALLERGSPQAVDEFLNLVVHPATSAASLAAVSGVKHAPTDALFSVMHSPSIKMRIAAARVLGTLNDPAVSKRLIELALNSSTRSQALVGLMSSSDPVAKQFLAYARQDLSLAAAVRSISHRYSLAQSVN
jgi:HEAT repeat protein